MISINPIFTFVSSYITTILYFNSTTFEIHLSSCFSITVKIPITITNIRYKSFSIATTVTRNKTCTDRK